MGAPYSKRQDAVDYKKYLEKTQPAKFKGKLKIVKRVSYDVVRKSW